MGRTSERVSLKVHRCEVQTLMTSRYSSQMISNVSIWNISNFARVHNILISPVQVQVAGLVSDLRVRQTVIHTMNKGNA